jgi:hypothetical protein
MLKKSIIEYDFNIINNNINLETKIFEYASDFNLYNICTTLAK